jgi:hypothetical protein
MPNAAMIPHIRKVEFNWEYLIPHVGLLRISSALWKSREWNLIG